MLEVEYHCHTLFVPQDVRRGPWMSQSCTIHQELHLSSYVQWVKFRSLGMRNHLPLVWPSFHFMVSHRHPIACSTQRRTLLTQMHKHKLSLLLFHLSTIPFQVIIPEISIFIINKWLSLHMTFYFKLQHKNVETVYVAPVLNLVLAFTHLNMVFDTLSPVSSHLCFFTLSKPEPNMLPQRHDPVHAEELMWVTCSETLMVCLIFHGYANYKFSSYLKGFFAQH